MFGMDKVYHFLLFAGLAFGLGWGACQLSPRNRSLLRLVWVGLGLLWLGVLEEYRQFFLPGRDTEFFDGVANLVGVVVGLLPWIKSSFRAGIRISWVRLVPIFLIWLMLFHGLSFLTSKGPPTKFFQEEQAHSQEVFRSQSAALGMNHLREKYLPQLFYVEKEHQQEFRQLVQYALEGEEVGHYFRLMVQLDQATDDEFEQIYLNMRRTVEQEHLSEDILRQVKQEFQRRKRQQRALIMKQEWLTKQNASD